MYPFYVKETFNAVYYKVNGPVEGLKVGTHLIQINPREIERLVEWRKLQNPPYIDLIPITMEIFKDSFDHTMDEINRNLNFKSNS
jgi:hypothetical protein